jgi:hypothetical protein
MKRTPKIKRALGHEQYTRQIKASRLSRLNHAKNSMLELRQARVARCNLREFFGGG